MADSEQVILRFIEWLNENDYEICHCNVYEQWVPVIITKETLSKSFLESITTPEKV